MKHVLNFDEFIGFESLEMQFGREMSVQYVNVQGLKVEGFLFLKKPSRAGLALQRKTCFQFFNALMLSEPDLFLARLQMSKIMF